MHLFWSPFWANHKYHNHDGWRDQEHYDKQGDESVQHERIRWNDLPKQIQDELAEIISMCCVGESPSESMREDIEGHLTKDERAIKKRHVGAKAAMTERKTSIFIDNLGLTYADVQDASKIEKAVVDAIVTVPDCEATEGHLFMLAEVIATIVSRRAMKGEWVLAKIIFAEDHGRKLEVYNKLLNPRASCFYFSSTHNTFTLFIGLLTIELKQKMGKQFAHTVKNRKLIGHIMQVGSLLSFQEMPGIL